MTVDSTVLELAALKAFEDHVKAAISRAKTELAGQLRRGTISAFVPDGEEQVDVGTIVVIPERHGWAVTDSQAFLEWVRKNRPGAIVESVRSSDQANIIAAIGTGTGEVPDGVSRVPAAGYVSVKQTPKQRDALLEAAGDGRLPAMPILQIGGGSE